MKDKLIDFCNELRQKCKRYVDSIIQNIITQKDSKVEVDSSFNWEILCRVLLIIGKILCSILIIHIYVLELLINLIFEIFNIITHSFLYSIIVSFLVIIVLLFFIFKIAPHTAYVSLSENGSNHVSFETTVDSVSMTNENPEHMAIRMLESQNPQEVIVDNCILYEHDDNGKLKTKQEFEKIKLKGQFLLFSISLQESNGNKSPMTTHAFIRAHAPGMSFIEKWIKDSIVQKLSGENISQLHESSDEGFLKFLFSSIADSIVDSFYPGFIQGFMTNIRDLDISYSDDLRRITVNVGEYGRVNCGGTALGVSPLNEDCSYEVLNETGEALKVEPITNGITFFPLHKEQTIQAEINGPTVVECDNDGDWDINVEGATNLEAEVDGSLDFIYGSKPNHHELYGRKISLRSRQGGVHLKINSEKGKETLSFSGEVSFAKLSGMDLFPSFGSWYRDEAYLIPLTLVSTIFSAVTLMQASRKKHGLNKDDSNRGSIMYTLSAMFDFLELGNKKQDNKEELKNREKQENLTIVIKVEPSGSVVFSDGINNGDSSTIKQGVNNNSSETGTERESDEHLNNT